MHDNAFIKILFIILILALPLQSGAQLDQNYIISELNHYTIRKQDNLHDIARRFDLGIVELQMANPKVDRWQPKVGTELILPAARILPPSPHKGIIINLAEMRLYHFAEDGAVSTHPIGPGEPKHPTPTGTTYIKKKRESPSWVPPDSIRKENPELPEEIPAGDDNPLGQYALNLGWPRFVIHGTNRPWSVGSLVSHGCIRMYPEDIEILFHSVHEGTPVQIIDDEISLGWSNGELYMDVHTPRPLDELEKSGIQCSVENPELRQRIINTAGDQSTRLDWYVIDEELIRRTGIPMRITIPTIQ